jgi:hypothetical protein
MLNGGRSYTRTCTARRLDTHGQARGLSEAEVLPSARRVERTRVSWFIQRHLCVAGELERRRASPALVRDLLGELDASGPQIFDGGVNVVAHEVQLVMRMLVGRMGCELGGRERENQPARSSIDRIETEGVAKERARLVGIVREDDRVNAGDHGGTSLQVAAWYRGVCVGASDESNGE